MFVEFIFLFEFIVIWPRWTATSSRDTHSWRHHKFSWLLFDKILLLSYCYLNVILLEVDQSLLSVWVHTDDLGWTSRQLLHLSRPATEYRWCHWETPQHLRRSTVESNIEESAQSLAMPMKFIKCPTHYKSDLISYTKMHTLTCLPSPSDIYTSFFTHKK